MQGHLRRLNREIIDMYKLAEESFDEWLERRIECSEGTLYCMAFNAGFRKSQEVSSCKDIQGRQQSS